MRALLSILIATAAIAAPPFGGEAGTPATVSAGHSYSLGSAAPYWSDGGAYQCTIALGPEVYAPGNYSPVGPDVFVSCQWGFADGGAFAGYPIGGNFQVSNGGLAVWSGDAQLKLPLTKLTPLYLTGGYDGGPGGNGFDPAVGAESSQDGTDPNAGLLLFGHGTGHLCWNTNNVVCDTSAPWDVDPNGNVVALSETLGGFKVPQILHGSDAGTSGVLSVNFTPNFSARPDCTCSVQGSLLACEVVSRSTAAAQFTDSTGGTAVINWDCKN